MPGLRGTNIEIAISPKLREQTVSTDFEIMSYSRSLITVKQAAEILGLSPKTVYAGKAGTENLRRVRNGRRTVRMVRQDVEAHLQRLMSSERSSSENKH